MPNWCANNIIVQGKPGVVKQFIQENFKTNRYPYKENSEEFSYILDFEQFDPTPRDEQTGEIFSEWYNWRLEHWGCKWSPMYEQSIYLTLEYEDENKKPKTIYDEGHHLAEKELFTEEFVKNIETDADIMKLELVCYCETPWGPPEGIFRQWMDKYGEMDLEVSLKFYEPGCCVLGELWFSGEDYCEKFIDDHNRKEYVQYLLNEGWESRDWFIEDCCYMIEEMHDTKEEVEMICNKVEEVLKDCDTEQAATLIGDIQEKYFKWMHEPKGDEAVEPSKE